MTLDDNPLLYLFAVISIGYGIRGFIRGEITYGIEGSDPEDDRTLTGGRAKLVSVLLAASGTVMLLSTTVGLCMVMGLCFCLG
jgi:hypothetical protein